MLVAAKSAGRRAGGTFLRDLASLELKNTLMFGHVSKASLVRGGRSSQEKYSRTALTLYLVVEPRMLRLPLSQPLPLLNHYTEGDR